MLPSMPDRAYPGCRFLVFLDERSPAVLFNPLWGRRWRVPGRPAGGFRFVTTRSGKQPRPVGKPASLAVAESRLEGRCAY